MSLHDLNLQLFQWINASENASAISIKLAIFIANDLFYLMVLGFLLAWFYGEDTTKKLIVKATFFTLIAFSLSQVISHYFYYPRPFVMEVGRTLIQHAPNGSFPSDHMLFFSTVAFSYVFSSQRKIGYVFLILAWMVAWSRVYLGVHFPLDMLGAFSIALLLNLLGYSLWKRYSYRLVNLILKMYQRCVDTIVKRH